MSGESGQQEWFSFCWFCCSVQTSLEWLDIFLLFIFSLFWCKSKGLRWKLGKQSWLKALGSSSRIMNLCGCHKQGDELETETPNKQRGGGRRMRADARGPTHEGDAGSSLEANRREDGGIVYQQKYLFCGQKDVGAASLGRSIQLWRKLFIKWCHLWHDKKKTPAGRLK